MERAPVLRPETDPLQLYLAEISEYSLINAERERLLGRAIRASQQAREVLNLVGVSVTSANQEDQSELASTLRKGDEARLELFHANTRLVVSVARRYHSSAKRMGLLDTIQEGNLGLLTAIEKFDPEKGFKFSTYATWWIRQAVTRGIAKQSRNIRLSVDTHEDLKKFEAALRVVEGSESDLDRASVFEKCATLLGKSVDYVVKMYGIGIAFDQNSSLDKPVGFEEDSSLIEFQEDPNAVVVDSITDVVDHKRLVGVAFEALSDRDKTVVSKFYLQSLPATQIGIEMGLSANSIRAITNKARRKMLEWLERSGYDSSVLN